MRTSFRPALAGLAALGLAWTLWANWPRPAPPALPLMRLSIEPGADAALVGNSVDEGQGTVLSPDGTLLAFVAHSSNDALPRLYVRRLEDLQATPLSGTEGARNPFFSPDGRWIAFAADQRLKKVAVTGVAR